MTQSRYKFKLDYITNLTQFINTPINSKLFPFNINQLISGLDAHNHQQENGRKLTPACFYINDNCDIAGYNIDHASSIEMQNTSTLEGVLEVKVVNTDFYIFDKDGNSIKLTENGRLKAGVGDSIAGDYTEAGAIFQFNSSINVYSLQQTPNIYANINIKHLVLSNGEGSVTLTTPVGGEPYSLTFSNYSAGTAGLLYTSNTTNSLKKADIKEGVLKIKGNGEYIIDKITLTDFPVNIDNAFKPLALDNENVIISNPEYVCLPVGSNTQRPFLPATGALRINSETNLLECFFTTDWRSATTESIGGYTLTDFYDVSVTDPFDFLYIAEIPLELGHVLRVTSEGVIINEEIMRPDWLALEQAPNGILNKPNDITDLSRHAFDEIGDVDLTNPIENHILKYDAGSQSFRYAEIGEVTVGAWGFFTGDIKDQLDLWHYLNTFVPWCPEDALSEDDVRLNTLQDVEELPDEWTGELTIFHREGKVLKFNALLKKFIHVDAPIIKTSPITLLNALYGFDGENVVEIPPPLEVDVPVYLTVIQSSPSGLGWTKAVVGGGGSLLKFTLSLLDPIEVAGSLKKYEVILPRARNNLYEVSLHSFYYGEVKLSLTGMEDVVIKPQTQNNMLGALLVNNPPTLSIECDSVNPEFFIFIRGI
jgi:hypothetical protein